MNLFICVGFVRVFDFNYFGTITFCTIQIKSKRFGFYLIKKFVLNCKVLNIMGKSTY